MTDDRSEFTAAREAGLRQRHEQRLARAQGSQPDLHPEAVKAIYGDGELIDAAYAALLDRVIANLKGEMRDLDNIIEKADAETKAIWARVRGRGIPDRIAERDAYRLLVDHIREIGSSPVTDKGAGHGQEGA